MLRKIIKLIFEFIVAVSILLLLNGCEGCTTEPNHKPTITEITVSPQTVGIGQTAILTATATDSDGDELTYTWSSTGGNFPQGTIGKSVQWTAPNIAGNYTITVVVSDGEETASLNKNINVVILKGTVEGYVYESDTKTDIKPEMILSKKLTKESKFQNKLHKENEILKKTKDAIPDVTVSIGDIETTSNASGYFKLQNIPIGEQIIKAEKENYLDYQENITVIEGTLTHDIYMTVSVQLSVTQNSLDFGTEETSLTFGITNTGTGTLNWDIEDDQDWITLNPESGSTTTETDIITVTVDRTGLDPGSYSGNVYITSNGGNATIGISMEISEEPVLAVTQNSLDFVTAEMSLTFGITNTGTGTLNWDIEDDQDWITVNPESGSTTTETDIITVTVDRTGLDPGSYSGNVYITSNGGDATVGVIMEVLETATVTGFTYYAGTTIPVSGVLVSINDITYTTGESGYFQLNEIPVGTQTITATKTDYEPYSTTIDIPSGGLEYDIEMTSTVYTFNVYGTVENNIGDYLQNCIVTVLNPDSSNSDLWTTTDNVSYYILPSVPQGNRTLQFSKNNYELYEPGIFLGGNYEFNAQLTSLEILPPENFQISDVSHTSITLEWEDRIEPTISGYNLYRSLNSVGVYDIINSLLILPQIEAYIDSNLTPITAYYYKISSVNIDNLEGTLSNYISATTLDMWSSNPIFVSGIDDVGQGSSPALADLDNDGDFDLLIGELDGIMNGYENVGTIYNPSWVTNSNFVSGIGDVGAGFFPVLEDLDHDGDYDLLIGLDSGGMIGYENVGTIYNPSWVTNSNFVSGIDDAGTWSSPALADLDNDGDFDLLIGERYGGMIGYENMNE